MAVEICPFGPSPKNSNSESIKTLIVQSHESIYSGTAILDRLISALMAARIRDSATSSSPFCNAVLMVLYMSLVRLFLCLAVCSLRKTSNDFGKYS